MKTYPIVLVDALRAVPTAPELMPEPTYLPRFSLDPERRQIKGMLPPRSPEPQAVPLPEPATPPPTIKKRALKTLFQIIIALKWAIDDPESSKTPKMSKPERIPGREAESLYRLIGQLTRELADRHPNRMKKADGSIRVGYAKDTGNSGVVGHLKARGYTVLSSSSLEEHIGKALAFG